jgi:hypothetical protein
VEQWMHTLFDESLKYEESNINIADLGLTKLNVKCWKTLN